MESESYHRTTFAMAQSLPTWWKASKEQIDASNLNKFRKILNATYKVNLESYDDIHAFSVDRMEDFYAAFWDWCGIRCHTKYSKVLTDSNARPGELPRFFDDARLNLAENV